MDVVVWLRSLGLGKYEAAFCENDIDETVLPGLTHETLKELGVVSIGHRVKRWMLSLRCVTTRACSLDQSRQHPRRHPLLRELPCLSQKLWASAAMSP